MGGCRCTYRNCSLRTDGQTHMFHYPVFDKVRCHQWLTNAHKLEFLNLKVSQLKNRVVCQHHFKDDNFMNFKKDKLTFDAVPTEDGPYCDSSRLNETNPEQEESKVFSISLDDIENEYLTIVDKKANFSVKYGDFLTNCDLMDLDSLNSLNQISDSSQANLKRLISEQVAKPNISRRPIASKRPVKKVRPLTLVNRGKRLGNSKCSLLKDTTRKGDAVIQGNVTINPDNTVNISKLIEATQTEDDPNSLNLVLNVSHVPIEFESTKSNENIQENIDQSIDLKLLDESKLLNDQLIDEPKLLNDQSVDEPKLINNQPCEVKVSNEPTVSDYAAGRNVLKERKKIRIISEKKISDPVPLIGKLEPVSPTRILTFPNKRRFVNPNPFAKTPDLPIMNSNTDTTVATDTSKDNLTVENAANEPIDIFSNRSDNVLPREIRTDVINLIPKQVLPDNAFEKTRSNEINKTLASNTQISKVSSKTSLLKNKIPPERVAAIAEKRKFNMKLRDIIEDCLDKLDEPDKSDFDKQKLAHKRRLMQDDQQKVGSYLTKDPELPSVQDYTIAYLDARLKKMEDNLLNKIGENSKKIVELKQAVAPVCDKRNVHTQTLVSEDVHKRQLYQELSKYLSQEANSLIYEELFINKYAKDVPKCSSPKRRKRRCNQSK